MLIKWNEEQKKILSELSLSFDVNQSLTDDQILEVDEKIMDYFQSNCICSDCINAEGIICESIIDLIADLN